MFLLTASYIKNQRSRIQFNQTIEGSELVSVGAGWWHYIVPRSIETIQINCFEHSKGTLRTVLFQGLNVKKLPNACFCQCTYLSAINLEACKKLKTIPTTCFKNCTNLKKINIPDSVEKVILQAFFQCNITEVKISQNSNISAFEPQSFAKTLLQSFFIPPKCKIFNGDAIFGSPIVQFSIHPDNKRYSFSDTMLYRTDKPTLVYIPPFMYRQRNIRLRANTTVIFSNACFGLHQEIDTVYLPRSLISIGPSAFSRTSIQRFTFEECSNMFTFGDSGFSSNNALESANLTVLKIKELNRGLFTYCTKLERVYLPSTLIKIHSTAFQRCTNLRTIQIDINGSLQEINAMAFIGTGLESLTIPINLSKIGLNALLHVNNMKEYIVSKYNTKFTAEDGVLFNKNMTSLLNYPLGSERLNYTVPLSVNTIEHSAFEGAQNLRFINFSEVNVIKENAFRKSGLRVLIIPSHVTKLESRCFANCTNLTQAYIDGSFTSLPEGCFEGCTSLERLRLPKQMYIFGSAAFADVKNVFCVTSPPKLWDRLKEAGISWKSIVHNKCQPYDSFLEESVKCLSEENKN